MKQVTIAGVKELISELSNGGVSLREEYVLACLRELVSVTEQRDAVVVENVGLKSKGRELLNEACQVYRAFNETCADGDFMDGQTLQEFQFVLDVESRATDAAIAALRAEAIRFAACHLPDNGKYQDTIYVLANEIEEGLTEFKLPVARQLRESKGAQG